MYSCGTEKKKKKKNDKTEDDENHLHPTPWSKCDRVPKQAKPRRFSILNIIMEKEKMSEKNWYMDAVRRYGVIYEEKKIRRWLKIIVMGSF